MTAVASNISRRQQKGIWITVISILLVICLFMAMFLNKMFSPRILSPQELRINGAIVFQNPRILREFSLVDSRGEAFTVEKLKGQWTLAYFGFTQCPDICPLGMATLGKVYESLNTDLQEQLQVALVSLDPARDTPEIMADYVQHFHDEFFGVTGDFLEIMRLTRDVNVAFSKVQLDEGYTIDHTGHIVLINPKGHYHGFFKPPFDIAKFKLTLSSIISLGI